MDICIHYRYDLISNLDFTLLSQSLVCVNDFILDDVKTWHFLCIIIQIMIVTVVIPFGSKTVNLWLWLVCLYSCILFSLCGMSKLPLCSQFCTHLMSNFLYTIICTGLLWCVCSRLSHFTARGCLMHWWANLCWVLWFIIFSNCGCVIGPTRANHRACLQQTYQTRYQYWRLLIN